MLISYRFGHTGKVCSGDYAAEGIEGAASPTFDLYFLQQEANFFYYYVMTCAYGILAVSFILGLLAAATLLCGSLGAVSLAEALLKDFLSGELGPDIS